MPSKKKKYNARFAAGRIKKIMQTDEEVGKVAQAVPVIISKALEMFIESLLKKSTQITQSRNAKTLTPSHMKQCILSESRFDFLKDLVKNVPDASVQEDNENNALAESNVNFGFIPDEPGAIEMSSLPDRPRTAINFPAEQSTSAGNTLSRTPVIKYGPKVKEENVKFNLPDEDSDDYNIPSSPQELGDIPAPALVSVSRTSINQNVSGDLCIDEDYDN
ncbi:hypothetical protein GWI33_001957 [Rhynchophorus ferrugineus]|uniref:Dr1-associated corepressor n=1 Tax=Rhynchophorus ferrugineus TaxID=354439 RepID=A0A834IKU8_RHYFE|nr:hypothetical protein GWI33_001957 [Rhynchophorus ferrugineus]